MDLGDLVIARPEGLYCPPGNFYIDPWRAVDRAVITHGYSDHARPGNRHCLTAAPGAPILRRRLGADITLDTLAYGEALPIWLTRPLPLPLAVERAGVRANPVQTSS